VLLKPNFKHVSLLISKSEKEEEQTRTTIRKKHSVIGTEKGRCHIVSLRVIKQPMYYNESAICLLVVVT